MTLEERRKATLAELAWLKAAGSVPAKIRMFERMLDALDLEEQTGTQHCIEDLRPIDTCALCAARREGRLRR